MPQKEERLTELSLLHYFVIALFISLVVTVAFYPWYALCIYIIAKRTNTPHAWLAWIPGVNCYLVFQIAKAPWATLLLLVPLLGIAAWITAWTFVAETIERPEWVGRWMIVPGIDLVVVGILAFRDSVPTQSSVVS
jgi:hypothetical protein